ncbi:glucose-6-phosphate isomerase [Microbulbifer harenosus]|uniref:Glucose-6-phosphate isomerase n=1 Tax=Microbulbifer harenosus TaxID=2576840 RepID=A0ABY2UJI4_9GAMM|nr:glucose-6-phosphate isomerase [Microbulbifer harenosus]TLM75241.1 glucose-6-phosphate isomerase [Microbulbifer harenosus]
MTHPASTTPWQLLQSARARLAQTSLNTLFAESPQRADQMTLSTAGLTLDYSKNRIDNEALVALQTLAEARQLPQKIDAMFRGDVINRTEQRQVLHTLLRSPRPGLTGEQQEIRNAWKKIANFTDALHRGEIHGITGKPLTNIINIGIGGSHLGPAMANLALTPYHKPGIRVQFVSNVDASDLAEKLRGADPETTLFIVASKTFTTQETLANAQTARSWLLEKTGNRDAVANHFAAVSTAIDRIAEFGIPPEHTFPMWDWVGGRYSIWSAIGLPLALAIGSDRFEEFLHGAAAMDNHFQLAPLAQNMPVILALLSFWYQNFWGADTLALLPYDHYLREFPSYVQQLDMESNGKSVHMDGEPFPQPASPIIWGTEGTNGQHSFHQLLHQGNILVPVDFILPLKSHNPTGNHHDLLVANCLSQSRALMVGKNLQQARDELLATGMDEKQADALAPHKVMPGNRPSNTLLTDQLSPSRLGALIALYEHKVFAQSVLWDINAFDQWGVELGKQICDDLLPEIASTGECQRFDASTNALLARYKAARNQS